MLISIYIKRPNSNLIMVNARFPERLYRPNQDQSQCSVQSNITELIGSPLFSWAPLLLQLVRRRYTNRNRFYAKSTERNSPLGTVVDGKWLQHAMYSRHADFWQPHVLEWWLHEWQLQEGKQNNTYANRFSTSAHSFCTLKRTISRCRSKNDFYALNQNIAGLASTILRSNGNF